MQWVRFAPAFFARKPKTSIAECKLRIWVFCKWLWVGFGLKRGDAETVRKKFLKRFLNGLQEFFSVIPLSSSHSEINTLGVPRNAGTISWFPGFLIILIYEEGRKEIVI